MRAEAERLATRIRLGEAIIIGRRARDFYPVWVALGDVQLLHVRYTRTGALLRARWPLLDKSLRLGGPSSETLRAFVDRALAYSLSAGLFPEEAAHGVRVGYTAWSTYEATFRDWRRAATQVPVFTVSVAVISSTGVDRPIP